MINREDLEDDLVSVVIPAYNCERTIGETLASVRGQTHQRLEILVVDDGSKDGSASVVQSHAQADDRVRLILQANGGVAAARNTGIEAARGSLIAPVDADDLWRPRKIERQLRAMRAGGEHVGLVYCWSSVIDEAGDVTSREGQSSFAGDVVPQLFYGNFVGNGSSALMRKDVALAVGGYDASLRARNAQGCEDWKLYLAIAERSHFAVVPDHLVGYRYIAGAMSGDVSQMLRSDAIVRAEILERYPEYKAELAWGRMHYVNWQLERERQSGNHRNFDILLEELLSTETSPLRSAARRQFIRARSLRRRFGDLRGRGKVGGSFLATSTREGAKP